MNRREAYLRRTEIVRREKFILISLFIIALFISITFISSKTYAGNFKSNNDSVKLFKSITIYSGDTVESIAAEFMSDEYSSEASYIAELTKINGITAHTNLIPGNKLIVPYYMDNSIETTCPVIEISSVK